MKKPCSKITIEIQSTLSNLVQVNAFLESLSKIWGLNEGLYHNIMLSLSEAVTNAIIHGNRNDEKKRVRIHILYNKEHCEFMIEDEGKGFDYSKVKNPTRQENLLKTGGRGIYLMQRFSKTLYFTRKGSCVKMYFDFGNNLRNNLT